MICFASKTHRLTIIRLVDRSKWLYRNGSPFGFSIKCAEGINGINFLTWHIYKPLQLPESTSAFILYLIQRIDVKQKNFIWYRWQLIFLFRKKIVLLLYFLPHLRILHNIYMFTQYCNKISSRFLERMLYGRVEFTHVFLKQVSYVYEIIYTVTWFLLCMRFS